MQELGHGGEPRSTFAKRAKEARLKAGLSQQQLVERLETDADVSLDTSAITRIESGKREPRLGEALAIARVLDFSLNNLVPQENLDYCLREVERSMDASRAALIAMFDALDEVHAAVLVNPAQLGDDSLDDRVRELVAWFAARAPHAEAATQADERRKQELLRAVTEGILVYVERQPATEEWYPAVSADDQPAPRQASARQTRPRTPRVESLVRAQRWDRRFDQLVDYVREHRDARVPRTYITPDGERLGSWVAVQRDHYARELLDPDRATKLERLPGWEWNPRAQRGEGRSRADGRDSRL